MKIDIQENIKLANLTTFRIGGEAKYFVEVKNKEGLQEAVQWAKENNKEISVLGGGSNVLVNDTGIDGLIVKIANEELEDSNNNEIKVSAGIHLWKLVEFAKNNDLTGLEWAIGIPGSVGGAVRGNAGAYGGEIKDNIKEVEVFDLESLSFKLLNNTECDFKYRESIFKKNSSLIVWNIVIQLEKDEQEKIKERINSFNQKRKEKLPKYPSAGCIFKNLFIKDIEKVNLELFKEINDLANTKDVKKREKIGCGYIIDKLNLKDKKIGGAQISTEHANFIINIDNATAEDVKQLINYIKKEVKNKLNIDIEEEVQFVGF